MDEPWHTRRAPRAARAMRDAAMAFLDALTPEQRTQATAPLDTPDFTEWTYLPGARPGLALEDMTEPQRKLALELLDTGLSPRGAAEARDIISLEVVLDEIERAGGGSQWRRDPLCYWFRVLGDPAGDESWAWRANGHHIAVHMTLSGDVIAATPQFFGANPAVVPIGARTGHQALPAEEHLARDLMGLFTPDQQATVIVDPVAPYDIQTRHDPVADLDAVPRGLRFAEMSGAQQDLLGGIVWHYLSRVPDEVAQASWRWVSDAGLDEVTFAWAGSLERGAGHYYAVRGPDFCLEYDNTQSNANHVHTVWRDRQHDWGHDLLAAHYAQQHR